MFLTAIVYDGLGHSSYRSEAAEAKEKKITGEGGERRLGLSLIGRLVDRINYSRDKGVNQVVLEKSWQN